MVFTEHSIGHTKKDIQIVVTFGKRYDREDLELCAEYQRLIIKKVLG